MVLEVEETVSRMIEQTNIFGQPYLEMFKNVSIVITGCVENRFVVTPRYPPSPVKYRRAGHLGGTAHGV